MQATATIVYRKADIQHANAWIWNNLSNKERWQRILADYSSSWRITQAHLSGTCRRKLLLKLFSESADNALTDGPCCDVCQNSENYRTEDYKEELKILLDALECIGPKGEVKVGEMDKRICYIMDESVQ